MAKAKRKTLNVLGRTVEVVFGQPGAQLRTDDGTLLLGRYETLYDRITVTGDASPDQVRAALLHEITHAVLQGTPRLTSLPDEEVEEAYVRTFETGFYAFLRHPKNMWALEMILEEE